MFWQKNNEEKSLPDLPSTIPIKPIQKEISDDDSENEDSPVEKHTLPAFPDSPMHKGFSQAAIKDAINPISDNEKEESDKEFKTIELDDNWSKPSITETNNQNMISKPLPQFPPHTQTYNPMPLPPPVQRISRKEESKKADIFVKIDKFYSAKRALESTENKLNEIDELLKKIRDVKLREEQEISAWEKDLMNLKVKIKEVTENIFEKIE
jgi:hypothetical protein